GVISQLVAALVDAGTDMDAEAIADALWLARARQSEFEGGDPQPGLVTPSARTGRGPRDDEPPDQADSAPRSRRSAPAAYDSAAAGSRAAARPAPRQNELPGRRRPEPAGPSPAAAGSAVSLRRASELPGALELGRALRPLKQRHPSKRNLALDAEATVEYF